MERKNVLFSPRALCFTRHSSRGSSSVRYCFSPNTYRRVLKESGYAKTPECEKFHTFSLGKRDARARASRKRAQENGRNHVRVSCERGTRRVFAASGEPRSSSIFSRSSLSFNSCGRKTSWFWMNSCSINRKSLIRSCDARAEFRAAIRGAFSKKRVPAPVCQTTDAAASRA